jgi:hypothetical protein
MNNIRLAGVAILILIFIIGCSGSNGQLKTQSEKETKATQQELIDNWSDYNISYNTVVIVFDPRKDDKKILVSNHLSAVEDQETWSQLVNGTKKLPKGYINQVWGNKIREIWLNNRFYGYVIHQPNELISARIVDENLVRLFTSISVDRRVY